MAARVGPITEIARGLSGRTGERAHARWGQGLCSPFVSTPGEPAPLRRTAGPVLLWALGVGYVISGDWFGWNFGLAAGGLGGMAIATVTMATLYGCMIVSIAELATAMPVAGGPFAFARRALGPAAGFVTGLAVAIEYSIAPAVIATGIAGYLAGWLGDPGGVVTLAAIVGTYAIFVGINLLGTHASLRLLLAITAIAAIAIVVWAIALVPHADPQRWRDVAADPGQTALLPHGWSGVLAALPAAGWFFLAIEGVPLAAEETRAPERDLPRAMAWAMATLVVFAFAILLLAPAVAGTRAMGAAANPLPAAAAAALGEGWLFVLTTIVGLLGFAASMLSIVYAYARQIFALARAGYLPRFLARTSRRGVPHWATIVPALVGLAAILVLRAVGTGGVPPADLLMQIAVFAALVSYVAMMASHLVLRRREPALRRPYRTPFAPFTPALALVLALVALVGSVLHGVAAGTSLAVTAGVLVVGTAWFVLVVRPRLGDRSVDEELALVRAAEAELDR